MKQSVRNIEKVSADAAYTAESGLCVALAIHERLVRDSLHTPYKQWCRWVHDSTLSPREKHARILCWKLNPNDYTNPSVFSSDYQLRSLLSKLDLGEDDVEGKEVAYRKFRYAEERCKSVNDLLLTRIRPSGMNQLLVYVKKIITECMGDVSDLFDYLGSTLPNDVPDDNCDAPDLEDGFASHRELPPRSSRLPEGFGFGPKSSVSANGNSLSTFTQKCELGTVTPNCWSLVKEVYTALGFPAPTLVRGSMLRFVPKKVGEMRTICVEPSVNMLFQRCIGKWIRRRLKAYFGINLRSQARNRTLAELGSLCDSWATEDETSASDLIASQLVLESFPHRWVELLCAVRSPGYIDTQDPGRPFREFEKFSTMGNGFTFELETLVFAAVQLAAIRIWGDPHYDRREIVAYGDDLCVPKEYSPLVRQALLIVGHLPNTEKSYASGPFRESCGGDFFNGWDVTPFKIKGFNLNDPQTIIQVHNGLLLISGAIDRPRSIPGRCDRALLYIENWLIRHYPRVSGGPIEKVRNADKADPIRRDSHVSSNRWLWLSRVNTFGRHGVLQPYYLCLRTKVTVCEYAVPATCYNLHIAFQQPAPSLTSECTVFTRNRGSVIS